MKLNQRSYLADFLTGFVSQPYDNLWELTAHLDDMERKYLLMLCFRKEKDILQSEVDSKIKKYLEVKV